MRLGDGTKPSLLDPGDYAIYKGRWWFCDPTGVAFMLNDAWRITEHVDGTVTVRPSINRPATPERAGWHGWLTRGEWIEVPA